MITTTVATIRLARVLIANPKAIALASAEYDQATTLITHIASDPHCAIAALKAVCYLLILLYFKARGGYKAVHIEGEGAGATEVA